MKVCTKCLTPKPESEFAKNRKAKDGLRHNCKDCTNMYWRSLWKSGAIKRGERRCLERYDLTEESYQAILESQNGVCAICGTKPFSKKFVVDHCHDTGAVRGLLCYKCNSGLGMFRDDGEILNSAITYLRKAANLSLTRI